MVVSDEVAAGRPSLSTFRINVAPGSVVVVRDEKWLVTGVEHSRDGALLTVTSSDPARATRIRALGVFGVMATGAHHQAHHLAIARGADPHRHGGAAHAH